LRACFIPLARAGFPLQGLSLSRSRTASRRPFCPLAVTTDPPPPCGAEGTVARLQGLAPLESPLHTRLRLSVRGPDALLGFPPSRVLPLPAVAHVSARFPSRASDKVVRDALVPAPQGLSDRKPGSPLARLPTLLGFPASSNRSSVRDGTGRAYRCASGSTLRHRTPDNPL